MIASKIDRLIDIERKSVTHSPSGAPVETWVKIAANLHASFSSVRGDERSTAPQWVAKEQVEFWVRYSETTRTVTPLDRIIYPADSVAERDQYDIMYVGEVGRNDRVKITAARRADV